MATLIQALEVVSKDFPGNGFIPARFSCKGLNVNPALILPSLPPETRSLAVIMEDPDALNGTFDHWVIWNIEPFSLIPENIQTGVQGINSKNKPGYTGPCPPMGRHRYFFKVYALDRLLDLKGGADKKALLAAMKNHIIAGGDCMGYFESPAPSI